MTTIVVSPPAEGYGLTVSSGDQLIVDSGGAVVSTTVLSGGSATLSATALAYEITVSAGGVLLGAGEVEDAIVAGLVSGVIADATLELTSGGIASGVTVLPTPSYEAYLALEVDPGATAVGTFLEGHGFIYGSAISGKVENGGVEYVESGGAASDDTVFAGGAVWVSSGGSLTNATIQSGGFLDIGVADASNVTVESGATLDWAGDITRNCTIVPGSSQSGGPGGRSVNLQAGANLNYNGATVLSGVTVTLAAGAAVEGLTVLHGGQLLGPGELLSSSALAGSASGISVGDDNDEYGSLEILSGGGATAVVVGFGSLTIDSGGVASGVTAHEAQLITYGSAISATLEGLGQEDVQSGGVSIDTTIEQGADQEILGGTGIGAVAQDGGQIVMFGGVTSNATVESGGALVVYEGSLSNTTVEAGGTFDFLGDITGSFVLAANDLGSALVLSGVTVSSGGSIHLDEATVVSGGTLSLAAGTITQDLSVNSGGVLIGPGSAGGYTDVYGVMRGVHVASAEPQNVNILSGGVASGTVISRGAYITVLGSAVGTIVEAGSQYVQSGGKASDTILLNGGAEFVALGCAATGTVVSSGAIQYGQSGATISSTVVRSGGELWLSAAFAFGVTISSGGTFAVDNAGSASATKILSGGALTVSSGGHVSGTVISGGGSQTVLSGGLDSATTVLSGGHATVHGVANATAVSAGGQDSIDLSGSAASPQVRGLMLVAGGKVSGAKVLSGGVVEIGPSGVDTGAAVSSGGLEVVYAAGTASGTTVQVGGEQVVSGPTASRPTGGVAVGTVVSGTERVASGGTISGLSLAAAGTLIDNGAAVISGAGSLLGTLSGSGTITEKTTGDLVLGGLGTAFSGQVAISGGTVELSGAHAIGTGSVVFAGGTASQTLQIDAADAPAAGGTFANTISNFSGTHDFIDLRGIAYVAGATASVSGHTLTLTDGGKTYKFTLAGSIGGAFPVTSDGHGGTLIDPQVAGFVQATASFAGPGARSVSLVSGGGTSGYTALLNTTASAAAHG